MESKAVRRTKNSVATAVCTVLCTAMAGFLFTCAPKKKPATGPKGQPAAAKLSSDPFSMLGAMEEQPGDRDFKLPSGPKPPRQIFEKLGSSFPPPA